jgi:hypothetical protein
MILELISNRLLLIHLKLRKEVPSSEIHSQVLFYDNHNISALPGFRTNTFHMSSTCAVTNSQQESMLGVSLVPIKARETASRREKEGADEAIVTYIYFTRLAKSEDRNMLLNVSQIAQDLARESKYSQEYLIQCGSRAL